MVHLLQSVVLWRVVVPLLRRHSAAYGSESLRDVILVEWRSADGISGWGECPTFTAPGYVTETTDQAWKQLGQRLVPLLVDRIRKGTSDREGLAATEEATPAAVAALRDSRLDNQLRRSGRNLIDHLGGSHSPVERTLVIASVHDDIDSILARAVEGIASGAAMIKVKIAPSTDVAALEVLAQAIGADRLAADANGSFNDAAALAGIDSLGLRYLEQPFGAHLDWHHMGEQVRQLNTPVALDESILHVADVEGAARSRSGRIVSIKPARLGGVEASLRVLERASELRLEAFVGGMVELAIGRSAALALAALDRCTLPTDLGPSEAYFDHDVAEPIRLDPDGRLIPPVGPGIGRLPDPKALERFTIDRLEFFP